MINAFDSDDVALMSRALERAWQQLTAQGKLNGDGEALAKAALTKAIVENAEGGERDEQRLAAFAIAHYPRFKATILDRDAAWKAG